MKDQVRTLLNVIVETVKEAGEQGAPAGPMYAALMTTGMSLEQFETIMGVLVRTGHLRHSNHCYFYLKSIP